jgi:iron(III) transport system permease protein
MGVKDGREGVGWARRWWCREWRWGSPRWLSGALVVAALIAVPLVALLVRLVWGPAPEEWEHIASNVLGGYLKNSLLLLVVVCGLSAAFALATAWWVAAFDFPGRRIFEWALILPLALPTYVAAFAYHDVLDLMTPIYLEVRTRLGVEAFLAAQELVRYGVAALVLAAVLYPYVYLTTRASFMQQSRSTLEAGRILGVGGFRLFWRVALPMARPAIAAGVALVGMEVLNDYGAVSLFGLPTLSVGIFRAWLGLGDLSSAVRLAAILAAIVFVLIFLERAGRGRRSFADVHVPRGGSIRRRVRGVKGWLMAAGCLVPLSLGFLVPAWRLGRLAQGSWDRVNWEAFWSALWHSLSVATAATVLMVAGALVVVYAHRLQRGFLGGLAHRVSTVGYALPGAVVAVGVVLALGAVDRAGQAFGAGGLMFSGSLVALGYAYCVRFFAVAAQPIEAGFHRLAGRLDEAARTLGASPVRAFWRIELPLALPAVAAAAMLAFIDIMKELPLTLVLRPFNYETLATRAYSLAEEGRIGDAALPSLVLVAASLVGLIPLNRLMRLREPT